MRVSQKIVSTIGFCFYLFATSAATAASDETIITITNKTNIYVIMSANGLDYYCINKNVKMQPIPISTHNDLAVDYTLLPNDPTPVKVNKNNGYFWYVNKDKSTFDMQGLGDPVQSEAIIITSHILNNPSQTDHPTAEFPDGDMYTKLKTGNLPECK